MLKRKWCLAGPSPLRQELTFVATKKCTIDFWFMGDQAMSYHYEVLDAGGNVVPEGRHCHGPGKPALCWVQDEGGPGGTIVLPDRAEGTTVTLRYYLQATEADTIRRTKLTVSVDPRDAGVRVPEQPVAWSAAPVG